jgi:hypothetical protein
VALSAGSLTLSQPAVLRGRNPLSLAVSFAHLRRR